MKRILFLAAFMLLSTTVSAQDVIVKKNGEEIRAKVEEVGEQSIRYRKFTNLTGPVYSIARGEVFVIRYESGAKDIITPLDRSAAAGKTQDTGIAAPSQQAMRQAVARAERRKRDKLWTFGLRAGAGVSFWSFKDDLKAQFGSSSEQVSFTSNPGWDLRLRLLPNAISTARGTAISAWVWGICRTEVRPKGLFRTSRLRMTCATTLLRWMSITACVRSKTDSTCATDCVFSFPSA